MFAKVLKETIADVTSRGYPVYSDDFQQVLYAASANGPIRRSALVVLGGNRKDPSLFERGSKGIIGRLEQAGYDVNVLDVDETTDYFGVNEKNEVDPTMIPDRNIVAMLKSGLANLPRLARLQIYAHAGDDINLINSRDGEIRAAKTRGPYQLSVGDIAFGHPVDEGVVIDIYACGGGAGVARLLARRPGVKEVYTLKPGYQCHFSVVGKLRTCYPRAKSFQDVGKSTQYAGAEAWMLYLPDGSVRNADSAPEDRQW